MKNLIDFIKEAANTSAESKTVTFDFTDLENGEETIKSLEGKEGVSIDGNNLTVNITSDNVDKLDTVKDTLQQFCQTIRNSTKRSSNEQYAQKTASFEKKVNELTDAIDKIANPDEDSDEEQNKD